MATTHEMLDPRDEDEATFEDWVLGRRDPELDGTAVLFVDSGRFEQAEERQRTELGELALNSAA